jgi:hypothetical protein
MSVYGPGFDIHPMASALRWRRYRRRRTPRARRPLILFYNFFDELRRRAPVR